MHEGIENKKYICFILAILILITGICLRETKTDSSFALQPCKKIYLTLDSGSSALQNTAYAVEETNPRDVINNGGIRIDIQKLLKQGRTYDGRVPVLDRQHAIVHYLQELDIRLCRTDNLTSVFTVIYIHHQDGVKKAGMLI